MQLTVGAESVYMPVSFLDVVRLSCASRGIRVSLPRYNLTPSDGGFFYEP